MQTNQAEADLSVCREKEYMCGTDVTRAAVGGKWKTSILWHPAQETTRFAVLKRQFSDTIRKMLTRQRREMETAAWCTAKSTPRRSPLPAAEKPALYDLISSSRKFW